MPGRLRCRKRKNSESRGSTKACPAQMSSFSSVSSEACVSRPWISCECERWSSHRRCSASPPPPSPPPSEDKENQQEAPESMDCEDDFSKTLFPDDDSNEVLPVEQFFGNMDAVKDFPQRSSSASTSAQRAQRRRRFYAREDSEEEEEEQTEEEELRPQQRH